MTYTRLYKSFQKFIDQDEHFTETEQQSILESFKKDRNKKIFRLSVILLLWSTLAVTVDSIIIGGSIIGVIMKGLSWRALLPTIIFSVINFLVKTVFIRWYLKKEIPLSQICLAGIPYLGSASVLTYLLRSEPLFGSGLQHYLRYLRKRGVRFMCNLVDIRK